MIPTSVSRDLRSFGKRHCLSLLLVTCLAGSAARADFKIIAIPDTQYYTAGLNGGTNAMWTAQTSWIQTNRASQNIAYVASLGDITDHGNTNAFEWVNAKAGFDLLESPVSIPYGTCVGNHDQTPNTGFSISCSTSSYNAYYGKAHFTGRNYYGGNYTRPGDTTSNDSHFDLFTADGMNFIVIYIEYDSHNEDTAAMNAWASGLLSTYASRKAIIVSHYIGEGGAPVCPGFGPQGLGIYGMARPHANVFLMLSGHVYPGWGRRSDPNIWNGRRINTLVSNYQFDSLGGGGFMRLYTISAANDTISAQTYSPHLGTYKTDANNQFVVPFLYPHYCSFDGNASTDKSLVNGTTWKVYGSSDVTVGAAGDIAVPGDYDGDGKTDNAVWRPSTGEWIIPGLTTISYGSSGDIPVPADYDADGKTDRAVWRPGTSPSATWFVMKSSTGAGSSVQYGNATDIPVPADYDGNGTADYAVYRAASPNSYWYVKDNASSPYMYGTIGDIPVPGAYTGNGKTTPAVWRPSTGVWWKYGSSQPYGQNGDMPAPGDYNGDGIYDPAVWRPSTNQWFVLGTPYSFGASGDKPLPLPYAVRRVFFP